MLGDVHDTVRRIMKSMDVCYICKKVIERNGDSGFISKFHLIDGHLKLIGLHEECNIILEGLKNEL